MNLSGNDPEEYRALTSVLKAFVSFDRWSRTQVTNPRSLKYASLSEEEKRLLPWFEGHLKALENCIVSNGMFFQAVAREIAEDWQAPSDENTWARCSGQDLDKVRSLMRQLVREWSDEGSAERSLYQDRIFGYLESKHGDFDLRSDVKILIPGAGLGRLPLELALRGFSAQGNEFSYHMLLLSSYLLNKTYVANQFTLHPFIYNFSHQESRKNQIRPVFVPDLNPLEAYRKQMEAHPRIDFTELLSMAAGSFTDLYGPKDIASVDPSSGEESAEFQESNHEAWDYVITVFFIDTASNIIDYLKTIYHCLKPGGKWINFGPLLWHFEDDESIITENKIVKTEGSGNAAPQRQQITTTRRGLELSLEDLVELAYSLGFEFEFRESGIKSAYGGDRKALGGWQYNCEYWVAEKRGDTLT